MVVLVLIGALFKIPWIIFLATVLFVILLTASIWKRYVLRDVTYKRIIKYAKGFPGEVLFLDIHLSNNKRLPVSWLLCEDTWPSTISPRDQLQLAPSYIENKSYFVNSFGLNGFQTIKRSFSFTLPKRGVYRLGPLSFESSDLFGFFHVNSSLEYYDYITVYPEVFPLSKFNLQTDDPFGLAKSNRKIFDDPIMYASIRDYQAGDPMKNIHWNATAKKNKLQVKNLQPVSEKNVVLITNIQTADKHWFGTNQDQFEYLLSLSGSILMDLISKGYAVGLLSNGCRSFSDQPVRILPGKSNQQISLLLEALASITQYTSEHNFGSFVFNNLSYLPFGSSIIIITNQISDHLMGAIQSLIKYRFQISLVYTGLKNFKHPDKIIFYHLPLNDYDEK
jgi:uncharacterized protein (DUF58 family)